MDLCVISENPEKFRNPERKMPSLVQRRTELVSKKSNNDANHKTQLVDCVQIDAVLALIIME